MIFGRGSCCFAGMLSIAPVHIQLAAAFKHVTGWMDG